MSNPAEVTEGARGLEKEDQINTETLGSTPRSFTCLLFFSFFLYIICKSFSDQSLFALRLCVATEFHLLLSMVLVTLMLLARNLKCRSINTRN